MTLHGDDDTVEVEGTIRAKTDLATLINLDTVDGDDTDAGAEVWVPDKLIEEGPTKVFETGSFQIQRWFLGREGYL